ncbi:MAG TPA: sensor domain-containing diguanylate cyclase [Mycobacteriales bacterium]
MGHQETDPGHPAASGGPRSLSSQLTAMFRLLIGGGLAMSLVLAAWLGWMLAASQPKINALQSATQLVSQIDSQLQTEQSDLRVFLASANNSYLSSYQSSLIRLPRQLSTLDDLAGRAGSPDLVAFEVTLQQWQAQWATPVANGTLAAQAALGVTAADPQQLSTILDQGRHLFDQYTAAAQTLGNALQRQLDGARGQQKLATILAASVTLLLALGTAGVGIRRQLLLRTSVAGPMKEIGLALGALMRGEYDAVSITPGGPAELHGMSTLVAALARRLAQRKHELAVAAEAEAERRARTDVILGVAREVAGSLNLRYVLEAVATAAASICGARRARLWLVETPGAPMLLSFDTDYGRAGLRERVELDLGTGAAGRAAKYGRPALGEGAEVVDGVPVVAVPLIVGARVVGALECTGGEPRELSDDVLTALETLATHAAAAIEASRLHQDAEAMSVTDPLTGLANRRQLDRDLPTEVDRAARYGRSLTVLFCDLDHFKQLNDRYGHSYGDLVLQQVGQALTGALRAVDRAYRLGGEEFIVVCPEATLLEGRQLADRLRELITRATSQTGTAAGVTASFGVATLPEHGTTHAELLGAADAALYDAKAAGRNRVAVATAGSAGSVPHQRMPYALPPVIGRPSRLLEEEIGAQVDAALQHVDD